MFCKCHVSYAFKASPGLQRGRGMFTLLAACRMLLALMKPRALPLCNLRSSVGNRRRQTILCVIVYEARRPAKCVQQSDSQPTARNCCLQTTKTSQERGGKGRPLGLPPPSYMHRQLQNKSEHHHRRLGRRCMRKVGREGTRTASADR